MGLFKATAKVKIVNEQASPILKDLGNKFYDDLLRCVNDAIDTMVRSKHVSFGEAVGMIQTKLAIHGIVRVVPPVATEEMIDTGDRASQDYQDGGGIAVIFNSMAAVGDLTKPPNG